MEDFKVGVVVYLRSNPERKMTVANISKVGAVDVAFFSVEDGKYVYRERFDGQMLKLDSGK